ncbi:UDP-N-acetylglucosamine 2-epimerase (non-hydrolyzing) [Sphingobacterium sp. CZ-UAM]|uniref:non-hydrolyzing UDP-N-acetylglucosamine 2-epimerase n=1 Tax=Sphingobacterium sp. CZ-UAM TaxID=1933868 RepID=UPI000985DBD1|nr:UDP-N-acetylglucosamine 2-epimerase (non-hydrolyzing) [Sphingobacterium sp. CZ-UAM]OOG19705.1 UDP-N-acetylglucosamine 2-epimerase (non-hydrolyzing) [Sphingobacterium sp. CZ-UAM]
MRKKKCLFLFGTRPEAIKMAPLVKKFGRYKSHFETKVAVTAQHREMLDQVLDFFEIQVDYDLDLMRPGQNLYTLTAAIIENLKYPLEDFQPDFVFVHGDTTTAMAGALAAFYSGAKVCHIEAGLRTRNKLSPFPEELNRQLVGRIADFHFAPTARAKHNLLQENVAPDQILVTGNTVVDALLESISLLEDLSTKEIAYLKNKIPEHKRVILVTGHRRENHGVGIINICESLTMIARDRPDLLIVFPVHLNPKIRDKVFATLDNIANVLLIEPLPYPAFVWLMNRSYLILTDSGGVQEEAPSLGKPVLVMRDTTERPEAVAAGTVVLVGTDKEKIIRACNALLDNDCQYARMSTAHNPYGDGKAADRILTFMENK